MVNKDGEIYNGMLADTIYMSQPAELVLNENKAVKMNAGDTKELKFRYETCSQLQDIMPAYESDDESVVRFENGKMAAVGEGSAVVTAYPYRAAVSVNVTVKADQRPVSLAKTKVKGMNSNAKKQLTVSWSR